MFPIFRTIDKALIDRLTLITKDSKTADSQEVMSGICLHTLQAETDVKKRYQFTH